MIKLDAKNRSKRLRKKLYMEEFKVMGFEIDMAFIENATEDQLDDFLDSFLTMIENSNLIFVGGGTREAFSGFVTPSKRYTSATEAEKAIVTEWLAEGELLEQHTVSELMDANYAV